MNKDLIETPRFICSLGDEVLLKGRIVAFDVDENKCVENVVRLEYGQTLNVANFNIYTKNNIIYELEKVKVPPFVADVIEGAREESPELEDAFKYAWEVATIEFREWFRKLENRNNFARAWLDGYEVEEEKRYLVRFKGLDKDLEYLNFKHGHVWVFSDNIENEEYRTAHTRKQLEDANFGWVFSCEGIEIEEVE